MIENQISAETQLIKKEWITPELSTISKDNIQGGSGTHTEGVVSS